jgi:protein MpaA
MLAIMKKHLTLVCLTITLWIAGCQKPVSPPAITRSDPLLTTRLQPQRQTVGTSVQNRPIETIVIGSGLDTTLIIATIHGNEPAGAALVEQLPAHLKHHASLLRKRKVVIVPVANPDGLVANTRSNSNDVDLNRNFAAHNRQNNSKNGQYSLSEPEARVIANLIARYKPDRIVTLHQPLNCIDYDGPARPLAERMGQHCDLPVRKLGARPGSLGAYAGETLKIPTITLELDRYDHRLAPETLWQNYGNALIAAIAFPERIDKTTLGKK